MYMLPLQGGPPVEFQEIACTSHQWTAASLADRGQDAAFSGPKKPAGTPIGAVPISIIFQLQARDEAAEGTQGDPLP